MEDFQELLGVELAGFLQVFNGNLHGKERIAQLVRETPRQFTPRGNTLGLHQALLLRGKRLRHVIEGFGELADLVTAMNVDACFPSSAGNLAGSFRKFFDRLGDPRGNPEADEQTDQQRGSRNRRGNFQDLASQHHQFFSRAAHEEDAQKFMIAAGQGDGVKRFRIGGIPGPVNSSHYRLRLLLQLLDERREAFCLLRIYLLRHQGGRNKGGLEVGIDERPHPRGQNQ